MSSVRSVMVGLRRRTSSTPRSSFSAFRYFFVDVVGPHGHDARKARPLQKVGVVGRIVGHQDGGGPVETVDQQAGHVVERGVGRAAHVLQALTAQPVGGSVEERLGHREIRHALEKAEKPDAVVVLLQVHAVDDGRNAADDPPRRIQRQKRLNLAVLEKGTLAGREDLGHIPAQRRDPVRVVPVELVRKVDEFA
ncbi:hypothetical protein [Rhodothermus marinus]|uniref:hypothetical protein n=1 Tax=Rhodothermus marinus TaxID=29549 RepID=UPI001FB3A769|nr:hypothetical protein [Rhodothermus marinus]